MFCYAYYASFYLHFLFLDSILFACIVIVIVLYIRFVCYTECFVYDRVVINCIHFGVNHFISLDF